MNSHCCLRSLGVKIMTNTKRYDRQIALPEIGILGQQKLASAKVLIIGAGGLGCPVFQNLAAAGVGIIGIVDGDVVEETNLHRQFLFTQEDCGDNKARIAAAAILKQNPEVNGMVYSVNFTAENAHLIAANYNIIVDCSDSFATRYLINDVALAMNIPMVYASIHKFEGQLSVFNYKGGPSYRCLFPEQTIKLGNINCDDAGVLGILPNTLGVLQATEVLKIILNIGTVLSGSLLLYDGLNHKMQTIAFERCESEIVKGRQNGLSILKKNLIIEVQTLRAKSFMEALKKNSHLVIDIRESYAEPTFEYPNIKNVTLGALEDYIKEIDRDRQIIIFCQLGNSSLRAANYLIKRGFNNVSHLHNGIESL